MPRLKRFQQVEGPPHGRRQGGAGNPPGDHDPSDIDLMIRARAGSASAFDVIVGRYWAATFQYAYHLVLDSDRASDIAQEAFARLWQRRGQWAPTGSVRVWLLRTARNLVTSDARKQAVRARWAEGGARDELPPPVTPLQELERTELRAAIELAVLSLSPRRAEVFTLFHIQDLSHREIAEIMDIRPQTVANYLQAAIADLRRSLAPVLPGLSSSETGF